MLRNDGTRISTIAFADFNEARLSVVDILGQPVDCDRGELARVERELIGSLNETLRVAERISRHGYKRPLDTLRGLVDPVQNSIDRINVHRQDEIFALDYGRIDIVGVVLSHLAYFRSVGDENDRVLAPLSLTYRAVPVRVVVVLGTFALIRSF